MNMSWKVLCASISLAATIAPGVNAEPSFGGNCASCHDRSAGSFNVLPSNLVEMFAGNGGEVTFNVTELGRAGRNAALAVFGLNAANLMATPNLTGWNEEDGGAFLSSDFFDTTTQVPLQLTIGAGATLGDYPINVTLAGGPGSDWSTARSFTIRIAAPGIAGDYNGNGVVDAADYVVWRKNDGTPAAYNTWRANFGRTAVGGTTLGSPSNAGVPEPASTLLLILGAAAGVRMRRRFASQVPSTH